MNNYMITIKKSNEHFVITSESYSYNEDIIIFYNSDEIIATVNRKSIYNTIQIIDTESIQAEYKTSNKIVPKNKIDILYNNDTASEFYGELLILYRSNDLISDNVRKAIEKSDMYNGLKKPFNEEKFINILSGDISCAVRSHKNEIKVRRILLDKIDMICKYSNYKERVKKED